MKQWLFLVFFGMNRLLYCQEAMSSSFINSIQISYEQRMSIQNIQWETDTVKAESKIRNTNGAGAFLCSALITGGGQFYNGQKHKAIILFGTAMTGLYLIANGFDSYDAPGSNSNERKIQIGAVLYFGSKLYSLIDAPIVSARLNKGKKTAIRLDPNIQFSKNYLTNQSSFEIVPKLSLTF